MRSSRSAWSVLSWRSLGSALSAASVGSALSFGSALSVGSLASVGSAGSILSIGSAGSILSIGSAGSILSIGSSGSILTIGASGRGASRRASGSLPAARAIGGVLAVAGLLAAADIRGASVADVDATSAAGRTPGSTVDLEWADGTTSQGTVVGTGRDVTGGEVELTVAIGGDEAATANGAAAPRPRSASSMPAATACSQCPSPPSSTTQARPELPG